MAKERPKFQDDQRNKVAQWLLEHSSEGNLRHGAKKEAALHFKVNLKTIWRIWSQVSNQRAFGVPVQVKSIRKGCIHKDKMLIDGEKVKKLSVLERSTLRCMSTHLGVSKSLLHQWVKEKKLKPHTNAIKPFLTTQNKLCRLRWSLKQLSGVSEDGFYTIPKYYLLPDEEEPHRTCKSKRHIEKIMFMCAAARPIIDEDGTVIFDGKLGIYPFITTEPAQRNSKNRVKGTLEVKAIAAITKPIIRDCLIKQDAHGYCCRWLSTSEKIQANDPEFQAVANTNGFKFQLVCQPANSPDTNVNDLWFFRAIQSLKDQKLAKNVEELLENVKAAYEEYPPEKLNNVFLTLQGCYQEIIKCKGGNNYKIPHMNKERLSRQGMLPRCIQVEESLVKEGLEFLQMESSEEGEILRLEDVIEGLNEVLLID
ncbi:uncharacterized protein LOC130990472 [Salvia miltiorrhiza]|uniref:uncharacterized protein LOC130990472 n=1 Tax=Salvia miltiorrhiza TaxID=226208 RepID=UPI0025ABF9DB|nr:uncharacterized protein LOC130990472 [Salvia miltiorrhiza]